MGLRAKTYQAVLTGATGEVGGLVLQQLLASKRCTRIVSVGRRPIDLLFEKEAGFHKVEHYIPEDMSRMAEAGTRDAGLLAEKIRGCGVAFSMTQTRDLTPFMHTSATTWSDIVKVDHDITLQFARLCRRADVGHFNLLSSIAAAPFSPLGRRFRLRGKIEVSVNALQFRRTTFYRPFQLFDDKMDYGPLHIITWIRRYPHLFPISFQLVRVEDLARAMRINAELTEEGKSGPEMLEFMV